MKLFGSIEGIPLITRFKTNLDMMRDIPSYIGIEGIPLITRFKTLTSTADSVTSALVLKVFHL